MFSRRRLFAFGPVVFFFGFAQKPSEAVMVDGLAVHFEAALRHKIQSKKTNGKLKPHGLLACYGDTDARMSLYFAGGDDHPFLHPETEHLTDMVDRDCFENAARIVARRFGVEKFTFNYTESLLTTAKV